MRPILYITYHMMCHFEQIATVNGRRLPKPTERAANTRGPVVSDTFTVHWGTADMRYKVTERTVFWVGQKKGAWSDLKIGAAVHVGYHPIGGPRRL